MALKTPCDFTGSLSCISSSNALGTICHDTPNLSCSHAHLSSRPPAESFSHNSSTSACVSQFTKNEMEGEKFAASSALSSNHKNGVIFCISSSRLLPF